MSLDCLQTPRLVGSRIRESHFEELARLHRDPRVMATLGGLRTDEDTRRLLAAFVRHWRDHGYGVWVFRARDGGSFIGRCGLRRGIVDGAEETEVMWAVMSEHWGKGFGTEMARAAVDAAFTLADLEDVVAFTLPENAASRRVMDKTGFTFEKEIEWKGLRHVLYRLRRANSPSATGSLQP